MKIIPAAALVVLAFQAIASPGIALDRDGLLTAEPPSALPFELYASDNPAAPLRHWQFVQHFTNSTRITNTASRRFYRVRQPSPPVALIAVLDTNSTIRARVDKTVTQVVARADSKVFQGWAEHSGIESNGNLWVEFRFRTNMPAGKYLLHLRDVDGFDLMTNITVSPLPSTWGEHLPVGQEQRPILPRPPNRPLGWQPASGVESWWTVTSYYQAFNYEEVRTDGTLNISSLTWMRRGDCTLAIQEQKTGAQTFDCNSGWAGTQWIASVVWNIGGCWTLPLRPVYGWPELADYDDTTLTVARSVSEHMTTQVKSQSSVYIGNPGTGADMHVLLGIDMWQRTARAGNEVWGPDPIDRAGVLAVGSWPASDGAASVTLPEGSTVDVTPTLRDKGWFFYEPTLN